MQYKTIILELIEQQPELHAQLMSRRSLLSTVNRLAMLLRERHLDLLEHLQATQPEQSPIILRSQALELALREIQEAEPLDLPPNPMLPESLRGPED